MPVPNKDRQLQARVTAAQAERYANVAEREGLRLSEWLRRLAARRERELSAGVAQPGDLPPAA